MAIAVPVAALAACGTDTGSSAAGPEVVVDTIGDTTVVRTMSGSVWAPRRPWSPKSPSASWTGPEEYLFGSIWSIAVDDDRGVYVFDGQAQHIRVFDSAGGYVQTLGRRGEGPGEFGSAEAIAFLPDGRLVVRDPRNMRVQVFDPGTRDSDQWRYDPGNMGSDEPLHTDARGRTFVLAQDRSRPGFVKQFIVMGPDGMPFDTLPQPSSDQRQPRLTGEYTSGGARISHSASVPFTPEFLWTVHPNGHFLTGVSAEYRVDLPSDDGVLRVERASDPVAVSDAEREYEREGLTRSMRARIPDWSWNGPPIPDHKPFFKTLVAGRDGRIWVMLSTEGQPVEHENYDPDNPSFEAVTWREPIRYDVFEPDGTYLGVVAAPDDFVTRPEPIFNGDHVWAVTEDELGVERVVRYRIVMGGG